MENLSLCRICLATDVRLCYIESHLRDMYERITAVTFKREDSRPLVVCYICHARLQNCYRLRTNCLRSEKLLTEMMCSGVLKPQDMLSTNTFRVVPTLQLSLGHALQDSTECHVKEAASEDFSGAEGDQLYTKDIVTKDQGEQYAQVDDNTQCSHLGDSLDVMKEEAVDIETDAEYIKVEQGNIKIEETGWEPDIASPSSQSADNICPKIVKVVSERIDLNDSRLGARVFVNNKMAALKDTEDVTTNRRTIRIIKNGQTEIITESNIVTKKIEVEKVNTSEILKTCEKVKTNLIECDDNVLTSVVNYVCEQKSPNDASLEQNVSGVPSRKNKPFSCDTCNKCFSYKQVLKNHILTHTGEKPYQCNVCKKCFIQKGHSQTHIRTHTGEKPYQCNFCKKCFNNKGSLKNHILTHTGDKPHQCYVCEKSFNRKDVFQNHIRTHTGEKPYQCNVCKKGFSYKHHLKAHIRTHTGDKPYQCNVCEKYFNDKGNLKKHIRRHTGEKPYHCNICKKSFIHKRDLKKHMRTHTS